MFYGALFFGKISRGILFKDGLMGWRGALLPFLLGDALLLETGDYLLLESGDKLLLE